MNVQVGRGGRVFAFEPLPHLAGYLRDLQAAGALRHMTVVEAALSDHPGEALLYMPDSRHQGSSTLEPQAVGHVQFRVHVATLTDFCARQGARPVHFIKADIEGYELELFRGAEELLREDRPTLLFECVDFLRGGGQIGRVFGYLEGLGYEGYFFPKGRMEPVGNFRIEKHQKNIGPDWCMNFGFVAKERKLV
jgi:FkbM family methyltransferase